MSQQRNGPNTLTSLPSYLLLSAEAQVLAPEANCTFKHYTWHPGSLSIEVLTRAGTQRLCLDHAVRVVPFQISVVFQRSEPYTRGHLVANRYKNLDGPCQKALWASMVLCRPSSTHLLRPLSFLSASQPTFSESTCQMLGQWPILILDTRYSQELSFSNYRGVLLHLACIFSRTQVNSLEPKLQSSYSTCCPSSASRFCAHQKLARVLYLLRELCSMWSSD